MAARVPSAIVVRSREKWRIPMRTLLPAVAVFVLVAATSCGPQPGSVIPVPTAGALTTCISDSSQLLQCWGANTGAGAEATAFVSMTPTGLGAVKEAAQ